MLCTMGRNNPHTPYFISGNALGETSCEKDLGVWTTSDCKPSTQCLKAGSKALSMLYIIRKMFSGLDKESFDPV